MWEDKHVEDDIEDCSVHFVDETSQDSDPANV